MSLRVGAVAYHPRVARIWDAILPVYFMRQEGFDPDPDAIADRLEIDRGKHGDTGAAEREQLTRLIHGEIDAAGSGAG